MSIFLYALYTLCYGFLLAWMMRLLPRSRRAGSVFLVLVLFGLFYDNLILALGNAIGPGPLLHALSLPRFVLHQIFLPWIMVSAFEHVQRAGVPWAQRREARTGIWVGSAALMIAGVLTRLVGLNLQPVVMDCTTSGSLLSSSIAYQPS